MNGPRQRLNRVRRQGGNMSRWIAAALFVIATGGLARADSFDPAEARFVDLAHPFSVRTGWSSRWPDKRAYLGDDEPGETTNLHFPGFSEEAMHALIEQRHDAAVGLDTASLDPGKSTTFMAHRIAAGAGVPGFENLTN